MMDACGNRRKWLARIPNPLAVVKNGNHKPQQQDVGTNQPMGTIQRHLQRRVKHLEFPANGARKRRIELLASRENLWVKVG